jgi:hypothetical protein
MRGMQLGMIVVGFTTACAGPLSSDAAYNVDIIQPVADDAGKFGFLGAWWAPAFDPNTGLFAVRDGLVTTTPMIGSISVADDDVHTLQLYAQNGAQAAPIPTLAQPVLFDFGPAGNAYYDVGGTVIEIAAQGSDGVTVTPATVRVGQFVVGGSRSSDQQFELDLELRYDCGPDNRVTFAGNPLPDGVPDELPCSPERFKLRGTAGAAAF